MRMFRHSFLVVGAAALLPLVAFVAIQAFYLVQDEHRAVEAGTRDRAWQIISAVDSRLLNDLGAARTLTTSGAIAAGDWAAFERRTRRVMALFPHWKGVVLWRPGASEPAIVDTLGLGQLRPQAGWPEIGAPLAGEQVAGISHATDEPLAVVHVPVERDLALVLTVAIAPEIFQQIVLDALPDGAVAGVVDREGRFIARTVNYRERLGQYATEYVQDAIRTGRPSGFYRGRTFEGFENYSAFAVSPLSGWSVHLAISSGLITAPRSWSVAVAVASGLACLAMSALLIWFVLRAMAGWRRSEEMLRQAQKLESIGQLTGGIAHDFNNLLTVVTGSIERLLRLLQAAEVDRDATRRAAADALDGTRRAAVLTQRLLAYSRRQALAPRAIEVNRLVSAMSDLLRRTLGETISVEVAVTAEPLHAFVDTNQLESAMLNLAVNARDAMSGGGRLRIETAAVDIPPGGTEPAPGAYVALTMRDTGVGMDEATASRAFEPFFTTKAVGQGTGLGLSQVYGFVRQSGGHVQLHSVPGEGTAVSLLLPRVAAEAVEAIAAPPPTSGAAAAAGPAPRMVVLLVEDDDAVRAQAAETLAELGHTVYAAADARSALDLLERHPEIELLFTDVVLAGGMNGRQLAEIARSRRPTLRVLYTTGYSREIISTDGRLDTGMVVLPKPYGRDALAAKLAEAAGPRPRPQAGRVPDVAPLVLLVEDEALVRINAADVLERSGYRVEEAGSAGAALAQFRARGAEVAAAIVDLGLPDRPGEALVRQLRELRPDLPVLVASGHGGARLEGVLAGLQPVGHLSKPYSSDELLAAVSALIGPAEPLRETGT